MISNQTEGKKYSEWTQQAKESPAQYQEWLFIKNWLQQDGPASSQDMDVLLISIAFTQFTHPSRLSPSSWLASSRRTSRGGGGGGSPPSLENIRAKRQKFGQ